MDTLHCMLTWLVQGSPHIFLDMSCELGTFSGFSSAIRFPSPNLCVNGLTFDGFLFFNVRFLFLSEPFLSFLPLIFVLLQKLAKSCQLTLQFFVFLLEIILTSLELWLLAEYQENYFLNSSFLASNCSWISYIFLLFSRSFVAGDTVSYWLKVGSFPSFFMKLYILLWVDNKTVNHSDFFEPLPLLGAFLTLLELSRDSSDSSPITYISSASS